jgi:hypothetical protein
MQQQDVGIERLVKSASDISRRLTEGDIPHLIVGSLAVYLHGAERKNGHYDDIDIFRKDSDEERIINVITEIGCERKRKHYVFEDIKIEFCSPKKYPSLPDPEDSGRCQIIRGVRVPRIQELITMKAEASQDLIRRVLSHGLGGPRRRSALKKHTFDFIKLVQVYLDRTSDSGN